MRLRTQKSKYAFMAATVALALFALCFFVPRGVAAHAAGGSSATASSLSFGSGSGDTSIDGSNEHWYRLTVTKAGYIEADVSTKKPGLFLEARSVTLAYFADMNGTAVRLNGEWTGKSIHTNSIGVQTGIYYIRITQPNRQKAKYNVTPRFSENEKWESEYNDVPAHADRVKVSRKNVHGALFQDEYFGGFACGNDTDWFVFTVPESGFIIAHCTNPTVLSARAALYDAAGQTAIDARLYTFSHDRELSTAPTGVAAGDYCLKLSAAESDKTGFYYTFWIEFVPWGGCETEGNDTRETADEIEIGRTTAAGLGGGDEDWFAFSLPHDGLLYWDATVPETTNTARCMYALLDVWDNVLLSGTRTESGDAVLADGVALPAGRYYVRFSNSATEGFSSPYTFTVHFYPTDDVIENPENRTALSAKPIEPSVRYSGNAPYGKALWFALRLPAAADLRVSVSEVAAAVFDENGMQREIAEEEYQTFAAGTHYIRLRRQQKGDATYSICLRERDHVHTGEWTPVPAADCGELRQEMRTCEMCGETQTRTVPWRHRYDEGTVTKKASVTAAGKTEYVCLDCGHTETRKDRHLLWVLPVCAGGAVLLTLAVLNFIAVSRKHK